MVTRPPGSVKVRFEWDKQYYFEHIHENYPEPDVHLCIGEMVIPPQITLGSYIWDTLLSMYQALGRIDVDRLGEREKDLEFMISNDPDNLRMLQFDERVYNVSLLPTEDEEILCISYEYWEETRNDRTVEVPLKDFVHGILNSNIEYFNEVQEIRALKEVNEDTEDALEQLNTSFQIIKDWYFARWEPTPSPDDPLFSYRYIPPKRKKTKDRYARFTPSCLAVNLSVFQEIVREGGRLPFEVRRRLRRRPYFGFGRIAYSQNASLVGRYRRRPSQSRWL